jgi:hypothetical protein
MTWKLTYYDEVKHDVRDAKNWYFKQQPGLEKRFAEDVKQTLDRLKKNPLHYEIKYRNVRKRATIRSVSLWANMPETWSPVPALAEYKAKFATSLQVGSPYGAILDGGWVFYK